MFLYYREWLPTRSKVTTNNYHSLLGQSLRCKTLIGAPENILFEFIKFQASDEQKDVLPNNDSEKYEFRTPLFY